MDVIRHQHERVNRTPEAPARVAQRRAVPLEILGRAEGRRAIVAALNDVYWSAGYDDSGGSRHGREGWGSASVLASQFASDARETRHRFAGPGVVLSRGFARDDSDPLDSERTSAAPGRSRKSAPVAFDGADASIQFALVRFQRL